MKKVLFFVIGFLVFPFSLLYSQSLQIVNLEGKVWVRKLPLNWQLAKLGMLLDKDYEVKTEKGSSCILSLDSQMDNVIKIDENSQVKIESLLPSQIFLSKGRVFSLIKNLKQVEGFKVRTPVAVAGARGTGWISGFGEGARFLCFEDVIHVQGFDPQGNPTGEEDVSSGSGIDVDSEGNLSDVFELTSSDYQDWQGFKEDLGEVTQEEGRKESEEEVENVEEEAGGGLEDVRGEAQEDQSQTYQEERREEEERGSTGRGEAEQEPGGGQYRTFPGAG